MIDLAIRLGIVAVGSALFFLGLGMVVGVANDDFGGEVEAIFFKVAGFITGTLITLFGASLVIAGAFG